MKVRGTSSPANALVDDCLVQEAKRHFAEHGAGEWKLHAKRRIVIPTRVVLDPDSLRSYAMNHATDCLPTPEKGATSTITVTANPEDRQFTIVATGSPIRPFLTGKPCVALADPAGARRGIFAVQLHAGPPCEVRYRNIRIELAPQVDVPHEGHAERGK